MILVIRCNAAPEAHEFVMKVLALYETDILYQRQGRRYIVAPKKINPQGWLNLCSYLMNDYIMSFEVVQGIESLRTGDKARLKKKKQVA